jgi:hypothetical protein
MDTETLSKRIVIELANMESTEMASQAFCKKYDLGRELASPGFPLAFRHHPRLPDLATRVAYLRDLAQRLWGGGGDAGGIEILEDFLFRFPVETRAVEDRVRVDWRRQKLTYEPQTKLQAAFYYLLQHSNLAKVCGNRGRGCARRHFIGKRANERYCTDACFAQAQRSAKKEWWDEHGEEWRTERAAKKKGEKKS